MFQLDVENTCNNYLTYNSLNKFKLNFERSKKYM